MNENPDRARRVSGPWLQAPPLRKVLAALAKQNIEARIVGGSVRNALIGRAVTDIDIATPALPEDVIAAARAAGLGAHPTGIDHGTVTLVADGVPFEATTLRRDVETDGRRAVVAFTPDWREDAERRDFTINALYCDAEGFLYDPIGGLDDLRNRRIRFIGDAETRIREDYLRILRFFRFSADYGHGRLDAAGLAACVRLQSGLSGLSADRVRVEILKLLGAPEAAKVVQVMHVNGILERVIPAPASPECLSRLQAIERVLGVPADPLTRLAALAVPDPHGALPLAERMRLSNAEGARLEAAALIDPALDPGAPQAAARGLLYRLGPEAFRRAVRVSWARSGAPETDNAWRARALLPDRWKAPKMPFSGADVIALGVPEGTKIGSVLRAFEDWWLAGDFSASAEQQRRKLSELAAHIFS